MASHSQFLSKGLLFFRIKLLDELFNLTKSQIMNICKQSLGGR